MVHFIMPGFCIIFIRHNMLSHTIGKYFIIIIHGHGHINRKDCRNIRQPMVGTVCPDLFTLELLRVVPSNKVQSLFWFCTILKQDFIFILPLKFKWGENNYILTFKVKCCRLAINFSFFYLDILNRKNYGIDTISQYRKIECYFSDDQGIIRFDNQISIHV